MNAFGLSIAAHFELFVKLFNLHIYLCLMYFLFSIENLKKYIPLKKKNMQKNHGRWDMSKCCGITEQLIQWNTLTEQWQIHFWNWNYILFLFFQELGMLQRHGERIHAEGQFCPQMLKKLLSYMSKLSEGYMLGKDKTFNL